MFTSFLGNLNLFPFLLLSVLKIMHIIFNTTDVNSVYALLREWISRTKQYREFDPMWDIFPANTNIYYTLSRQKEKSPT